MPIVITPSVRIYVVCDCSMLTPTLLVTTVGIRDYKYLAVAEFIKCEGIGHLERVFQDILDGGGEGVILRNPESGYEPGNSHGYLKHKVSSQLLSYRFTRTYSIFSYQTRNSEMPKPK